MKTIKYSDIDCGEYIFKFLNDNETAMNGYIDKITLWECNFSMAEYVYYFWKEDFRKYMKEKGFDIIYA